MGINYSLIDHFLIEMLHLSCCENRKTHNRVFNPALVTLDIKSSTYLGGGAFC